MQNWMNNGYGMMGGFGPWSIAGILLVVFLVFAIIRLVNKK